MAILAAVGDYRDLAVVGDYGDFGGRGLWRFWQRWGTMAVLQIHTDLLVLSQTLGYVNVWRVGFAKLFSDGRIVLVFPTTCILRKSCECDFRRAAPGYMLAAWRLTRAKRAKQRAVF